MKWIKTAIGAVIAVFSISIIATSVYGMTQERVGEEVVTFEVLTYDSGSGTVTSGTYDKLEMYSIKEYDEFYNIIVTNVTSILINGVETLSENFYMGYNDVEGYYDLYDTNEENNDVIHLDDTLETSLEAITLNDTVSITFEVTQPPHLTGSVATLILLTPLICIGGFLIYLFRKQNY